MELVLGPTELSVPFSFSIPTLLPNGNDVKQVGIYSSGGLDSTALLCLILSELRDTGKLDTVSVTALTVIKGEGSTYYSQRVVDKISSHFGVNISHTNNIENNEPAFSVGRVGIVPVLDIYSKNKDNMVIYMGVNRMAPDNIRPFKQILHAYYKESPFYKSPFIDLHKPQIMDLYYKLGCEDIIPYTHSCTVLAEGKCDNCYSCMEKLWAFNALGKAYVDTIPPDIEDISFNGTWTNSQ